MHQKQHSDHIKVVAISTMSQKADLTHAESEQYLLASTEHITEVLHIDRKKYYCLMQHLKKDFINIMKDLLLYLNDDQFNAFSH